MIAQSVADILSDHVRLTVEGIDRMYLNVYVPRLQMEQGIAWFFREHRGQPVPSAALMSPMSRGFVAALDRFATQHQIPVVQFRKGERKHDVMAMHLRQFAQDEGVVFIGKAQEKTPVFRTERRTNPKTGQTYPWIVRSTAMVNHYYIYALDRDFGPFFLKFCSYFSFNARLCLNGHEYAKRQLAHRGIAFEALDNGILSCANPKRLQQICDNLSGDKINALLRKWLARLPHPFTGADRKAGYRYEISILQAEFSLTQVFDKPQHGRLFFEHVIRENLDLGRPEEVRLIFNRRLLEVERLSHDCMLAEDTFQAINSPVAVDRQRASGLRFADPRVQSLWHAIMLFRLLPDGFRSADLRKHLAPLTGRLPENISQGAITYQLRRLRLHGIIERLPHSFRYRVTQFGFRAALFFTRLYNRLLRPTLFAILAGHAVTAPPLRSAFEHLDTHINASIQHAQFAA